ncbi:MAG: hypothetical protein ABIJ97_08985 [Bacteroidota bacterium]
MIRIFFLCLIIVVFSCKKKEDKILLSGTISDPNKNSVISDVKINLSAQLIENGTWNSNYTNLTEVFSDSEGKFDIETANVRASKFKLTLFKENYILNEVFIDQENIIANELYEDNFNIYSESHLTIFVINQYPFNSNDYLKYRILNGTISCTECCDDEYLSFTGQSINDTISCTIPGNQQITIEWQVIKNSNPANYTQNIDIQEFTTSEFSIIY